MTAAHRTGIEELEARILYSADAALLLGGVPVADVRSVDTAQAVPAAPAASHWLVVDRRVEDWDLALADRQARDGAASTPSVLLIDTAADGRAQVAGLNGTVEVLPWTDAQGRRWLGASPFDANPAATAAPADVPAPAAPPSLTGADTSPSDRWAAEVRHELVVIDGGIAGASQLAMMWWSQATVSCQIEVVVTDPARDGLAQITDLLSTRTDLAAVHLVSHGDAGLLQLGTTTVDASVLAARAEEVAGWRHALTAGADLLVYGCDVAQGLAGAAFVHQLSDLTGADVAASTNLTGSAAAGGDWTLEVQTGQIEHAVTFDAATQAEWQGTLATYAVTNLNDSGAGSLRQAITNANANGGADSITFSTFGTINLASALPQITGQVTINGTNGGVPGVVLNGGNNVANGLDLGAGSSSSTIRGLVLQAFTNAGISVSASSGTTIAGNYIGTDAGGNVAVGNNLGVNVFNAASITIGGTTAADRNVISGNTNIGVNIVGAGSSGTVVSGNYIGTNAAGSADQGNTWHGVFVDGVSGVTIGGSVAGAGNVVSGNGSGSGAAGITLGSTATRNVVAGNTVGLNAAGTGGLANSGVGIFVLGASNTIGGTVAAARNVVSGNTTMGINISGSSANGNTVAGNYIGTSVSGLVDMGNGGDGIQIDSGASGNTVGGLTVAERNIVAGNGNSGVAVDGASSIGNVVLGNYIGLAVNGTSGLANADNGVSVFQSTDTVIGSTDPAGRNVIASNALSGIAITDGVRTLVKGNYIGVDATGTLARGNAQDGIRMTGNTDGVLVGGAVAGAANLIANNTGNGVLINTAAGRMNTVIGNAITANGKIGIDLGADNGVTANDLIGDGDTGANNLQNFPVLSSVASSPAGTTIVGSLTTNILGNYRIDFYANHLGGEDGTGYGEGERYLGYTTVSSGLLGTVVFNTTLTSAWVNTGDRVTATATVDLGGGAYGATSEFAMNVVATASGVVVVDTTADTIDGTTTSIAQLGNSRGGDQRISLREAITAVNNTPNGATPDKIVFGIDGFDAHTIALTSLLPTISQAVNIDGTSDDSFVVQGNRPAIVLDGGNGVLDGLRLYAGSDGSSVRGLNIQRFTQDGIDISGSNGNTVAGNWFGIGTDGVTDRGNQQGVNLWNTNNNVIGGSTAADRNVISGNSGSGIWVGGGATGNQIMGNYIGTTVAGDAALANDGEGILIESAGNSVGGTAAGQRNVISGNGVGLCIQTTAATGNVVVGNYIGTDSTGTADLNGTTKASGVSGVVLQGGASGNRIGTNADGSNDAAERNVISGNNWFGVEMLDSGTTNNVVQGNYIGTDMTGLVALGNSQGGVSFWNGASGNQVGSGLTGAGNVISGNETGVLVANGASNNRVQGNLIGLGADGSTAVGNTGAGVYAYNGGTASAVTGNLIGTNADGSNDAGERNIIAANYNGVLLENAEVAGNTVAGNYIGTDATGLLDRGNVTDGVRIQNGANANTVGGSSPVQHNVITGNDGNGVHIDGEASDGNVVRGNWIGVNAAGNGALGNGGHGIYVFGGADNVLVGGTGVSDGNWIASPTLGGIFVKGASSGTVIQGNRIGTDLAGSANWGTGQISILLENGANHTLVGGTTAGAANLVANAGQGGLFQVGIGVLGATSTDNAILGNTVYNSSGLGIDLGNDGVTVNDVADGDSGANNLQNFPVLASAYRSGADTKVTGSLDSTAGTSYRIEFYSAPAGDSSGHGEGAVFLGATTVTTNGSGSANFSATLTGVGVTAGQVVSATATVDLGGGSYGSTSEFAFNITATDTAPDIVVQPLANTSEGQATGRFSVVLTTAPTSDVTIAVSVTDATELSVGTSSLVFTSANWNVAQTVTVTGVDDTIVDGNVWSTITLAPAVSADPAYNGLDPADVSMQNADNDTVNTVAVTTASDIFDGDTSSIAALLSNQGADGHISLREAITAANNTANATGGADRIVFDIADPLVGGVHTITLAYDGPDPANLPDALPTVTDAVVIDATTGADWAASGGLPVVVLDGSAAAGTADGLSITAGNSTVRGLVIQNFGHAGLSLRGGGGNTIEGNFIGTNAAGTAAAGNAWGLVVDNSANNVIGGTTAAARNLISGNVNDGINLSGTGSTGNQIQGNRIGTNLAGTSAVGNAGVGIGIGAGASGNTVGGPGSAYRNLVSGNAQYGVYITDAATSGNVVQANWIGVDAAGTGAVSNGGFGVVADMQAAFTTIAGNVISGNTASSWSAARGGIYLYASGVTIQGNLIGLDAAGTGLLGNGGGAGNSGGILVNDGSTGVRIGGTGVGEGNTIAGNTGAGAVVMSTGAQTTLLGNTFHDNTGLAIDLGNDGLTANDAGDTDVGANTLLNTPLLYGADILGTDVRLRGEVNTTAGTTLRIEFFSNPLGTEDPTGYGEGVTFLGYTEVTTDGTGRAALDVTLTGMAPATGDRVSATATVKTGLATYGATSEFAMNVPAAVPDQAPVLTLSAYSASYTENAVALYDPGATLTDSDNSVLNGGQITGQITANGTATDELGIRNQGTGAGQIGLSGSNVTYGGIVIGTCAGFGDGSTPLVVTFNSNATTAAVQALLRNVTYRDTSDNPSTATRTIALTVNDGSGGTSTPAVVSMAVVAVNDAPVLTDGSTVSVSEGAVGAPFFGVATLSDVDNTSFGGGTLSATIRAGGESSDVLQVPSGSSVSTSGANVLVNGVTVGTWAGGTNGAALVVSFNANATVVRAQAVYEAISFSSTSDNPTSGLRTIAVVLTDGSGGTSNTATGQVNLTAVNDAPVFGNLNGTPAYTENAAAVVLDADAVVSDAELTAIDNFSGATLTLVRHGGADTQDQYSATGTLGALTEGGPLVVGGAAIGVVTANSAGTLVLTFDAGATNALVNAALQQIAYASSSDRPPASVQIDWNFSDGNTGAQGTGGASSASGSTTVVVTSVDDAPVITSQGGGASAALSVAENTTAVTTVTATDVDDAPSLLSYRIVGGADAAEFTIDSATGALAFTMAPDHESPADAGADNVYDVIVQVSDGTLTDTQAIAVTVTAVNDNAPTITSSSTVRVAENTTAVLTLTATDADQPAQALTFSIVGGPDAGLFTVDSTTGVLRFTVAPDFEAPTDSGADHVYDLLVQASDGTWTGTQAIAVTVTDVSNTLVVTTTADVSDGDTSSIEALNANAGADGRISLREAILAANHTANRGATPDQIGFAIADPLVGGAHTLVIGPTALPTITDAVVIDGSTEPDAGSGPVVVLDGAGVAAVGLHVSASDTTVRGLVISHFTGRGVFIDAGASNVLVAGNRIGTDVTGLVAQGNGNWGIDVIAAGSGIVIGGTTAADRNIIGANTGQGGIAINATNGATVIGNYIGVGADGTTALGNATGILLFGTTSGARIGGTAAGEGNLIANNGGNGIAVWSASTGNALLGNVLRANAGLGIDLNWDGAVQANDTGDVDAFQNYPVLTEAYRSGSDTVVDGTLNSTAGTTLRIEFFSVLAASADANGHGEAPVYLGSTEVTTDGTGAATFHAQLIGATTAVGDLVTATATVKTGAATYGRTSEFSANLAVTGSAAPVLSFMSGHCDYLENAGPVPVAPNALVSDADSPNFAGGRVVVYFAANGQAEDRIALRDQGLGAGQIGLSGHAVLYGGAAIGTWAGGTDGTTPLIVTFNASATPAATQALLRNITYANVSDNPSTAIRTMAGYLEDGAGGTSNTVSGTIGVLPVNDAPVADAGGHYAIAEGDSLTLDASASSDPDDAVLTFAWDLNGNGLYGETGEPTTVGATVDWAALVALGLNDSGSYTIGVRVTDAQGASSVATAALVIADRAPVLTVGGTGRVTAGQPYTLTLSASDAGADTITAWTIDWGDGTVVAYAGNPGSVAHAYLHSGATFSVLAAVTDEDGTHAQDPLQAHQVVVDNAAPVLTSGGGGASVALSAAENTTAVTTVTATDVEQPAQTLTFSITGGADAGRFTIDAATGVLRFRAAPDYEAPGDVGADNVYDVTVQVSDGALTASQAMAVSVTATNDNAPAITSGSAVSVAENTAAVTTVTASDADQPAQTLSFSIAGGADAARFTIDSATGVLRFRTAPDYEAPGDAGTDNVYDVRVQVTDGTWTDAQALAVTVTAVNDNAPTITSGSVVGVVENTTAVMTVTATDADQPAPVLHFSIAGGVDASRFTIDGTTGALRFVAAPDYEAPTDQGGDNAYDLLVQVSDGDRTETQAVTVVVTGVNDNAPEFTSEDGAAAVTVSVPEGSSWSTVLSATDADLPTQALTFHISGGADAALFELDPTSGLLAFKLTADHEAPQDANHDNAYEVVVSVSDGTLASNRTLTLLVTNVNEAPVLVNSQLAVAQGGRVVLGAGMLQATDPDTDAAGLVYTVSDVRSGAFEQVSLPGQAVTRFTQADVTAGRIVFVQSGDTATAGFGLTVSDGGWVVGPRQVAVRVQPNPSVPQPGLSSDPVLSMVSSPPRVEAQPPSGSGLGPASATGNVLQEPLAGAGAVDRLDRIMAEISASGNAAAATPGVGRLTTTDRDSEALTAAAAPGSASAPGGGRATTAVSASGVGPGVQGERTGSVRTGVVSASGTAPDLARLPPSELLVMLDAPIDLSGFVQERSVLLQWALTDEHSRGTVDSARQQSESDDAPGLRWDSGSAVKVGGMALSVGLVFWATRATGLVASLIAVSPPWRQFDPLPVLSVHTPRQSDGTEVEWLDTDIPGSLAELAEDILDQRT